ncbi:hypothetical protein [Actinacidiphila soli]|uniref:hypothetical protein n=1 Tax=Actinacidiphila soli TaxID=2487275 RepID=UPI000FCC217B|nr:hypothetical protein [Actinacidiphila soli]
MTIPAEIATLIERGTDVLVSLVARLEPGEHLLTCSLDCQIPIPARALITVTGPDPDDTVSMNAGQMDTLAVVLGAALIDSDAEYCGCEVRS